MPSDLELMRIQFRALFTFDDESRMICVNEPDGLPSRAPRLFLGRTREGNVWSFRAGLRKTLYNELDALCADEPPASGKVNEPPRHLEKYLSLLETDTPVRKISSGPAFWFSEPARPAEAVVIVTKGNAEKLNGGFEELVEELAAWQPFAALIEEGQAVSVCRSVRVTRQAHEAGVETLADFRGRSYAGEVVSEWARHVQNAGAIALYSTDWENKASQAVARKLGLKCFGTDFSII